LFVEGFADVFFESFYVLRFVCVYRYAACCFADLEFSKPWYIEENVLGSVVTVCFSFLAVITKALFEELGVFLEYLCGIPVGMEGMVFGL